MSYFVVPSTRGSNNFVVPSTRGAIHFFHFVVFCVEKSEIFNISCLFPHSCNSGLIICRRSLLPTLLGHTIAPSRMPSTFYLLLRIRMTCFTRPKRFHAPCMFLLACAICVMNVCTLTHMTCRSEMRMKYKEGGLTGGAVALDTLFKVSFFFLCFLFFSFCFCI